MGDIPLGDENKQIVVDGSNRSNLAEAFRLIRTNIDFLLNNNSSSNAHVIGVTSTIAGEGKSFVSLNIASTLAISGKKVLLVGMDLKNQSY